jgi:probable HAF family extracellular repeat protein
MFYRRRPIIGLALLTCVFACHEQELPTSTADPDLPMASKGSVGSRVDLGTLGGLNSFATDVNDQGTVVGWSMTSTGLVHAFRWTSASGMADLGTLPGDEWSEAFTVLNNGRILGVSGRLPVGVGRPVIWSPDGRVTMLTIPTLPGADQAGPPTDMNASGAVIGWDIRILQRGWYWDSIRGKIDITSAFPPSGSYEGAATRISASGWVVGVGKSFDCRHVTECWRGMLWHPDYGGRDLGVVGGVTDAAVAAEGVNNAATVVGWAMNSTIGMRPYLWTSEAGFELLGPEGTQGVAMGINAKGLVVGSEVVSATSRVRPAVYRHGGEVVALEDTTRTGIAVAISDNGIIAGWQGVAGVPGLHATVWTLGSASPSAVADRSPGPPSTEIQSDPGPTGLEACLSDPDELVSRWMLFDCVRTASAQ